MAKERNAEKIASKLDIVATAFGDLQKTEVGSDFAMMLLQTTLRAVTSAFSEDIKTTFPDVKARNSCRKQSTPSNCLAVERGMASTGGWEIWRPRWRMHLPGCCKVRSAPQ
jgi:hypothetical protein